MKNGTAADPRLATLGDTLVRVGVIDEAQLAEGLQQCAGDQKELGRALIGLGFVTEEKMIKAVSIRLGIPYFTSFDGMLDPEAARAVPEAAARRHLAVPIFRTEDTLTVGMVNPIDIQAIDELSRLSGLRVTPVMTTISNLFDGIQQAYGMRRERVAAEPAAGAEAAPAQAAAGVAGLQARDKSVVELVDGLFQEGMSRKASDIHLEPFEKALRVRFRTDGVLQGAKKFSKDMEAAIVARVKILAKLDITETRLPQDGHLRYVYGDRGVDVRVSTLPTVYGEKVVLRILDSTKSLRPLTDMGLRPEVLKSFQEALRRPNGIILVTGPTGSGKTTTLYGAIAGLNDLGRNIVTIEDPVEYRIEGLNQVETHAKIGLTFAAGLRSILRQDPNVILLGEIRDLETAEIATQAAITGHLVLSTLHTNDAVAAVHRLINMRVEPFLIAAALGGVLAQRLLRRVCPKCEAKHALTPAELEALGATFSGKGSFIEGAGCEACFGTGYSGRLAIHEWLPVSRKIRELVLKRASVDALREAARGEGMVSLHDDALQMAREGKTSVAEVIRVTREETEK